MRSPAPFIVGIPRSGTTLLRFQLDAHPQLAIPPETGFGLVLEEVAGRDTARDDLLARLTAHNTWPDLGLDDAEMAAAFAALPEWSVGEGLRTCYRAYAARHGKPRWGDKTPLHTAHLHLIAEALPEARFIHLIRDGRDVAASLRSMPFAPGDGGVEAIARAWRDGIVETRRLGARVPHYREVRYERLVEEPEATLGELCAFLDLSFDAVMLRSHERVRDRLGEQSGIRRAGGIDNLPPERWRLFRSTLRPPDPTHVGRWREALTPEEVATFHSAAGDMLAALDYPRW